LQRVGVPNSGATGCRFAPCCTVVREGLRLVEEREARLRALSDTLNASIAEGGECTDDDVAVAIDAKAAELARQGF
jgi:antitoxin ParD1/3/4